MFGKTKPTLEILKKHENILIIRHVDQDNLEKDRFDALDKKIRRLRASTLTKKAQQNDMSGLWLSSFGVYETFNTKLRRILDVGTLLEPVCVQWLREDGWIVKHNHDDSIGMIIMLPGGIITGHHDVVMKHPQKTKNRWILGDVKTMSIFSYDKFRALGTEEGFPEYADQTFLYAVAYQLSHSSIIGVCKNDSTYEIDIYPTKKNRVDILSTLATEVFAKPALPEYGIFPYPKDEREIMEIIEDTYTVIYPNHNINNENNGPEK